MALKFPDILQNNNSNYPLVDITEIRGNAYPVGLLSETGSIPVDKRKVGAILFSTSSQQFYGFFGQTAGSSDWNNPNNWKSLSSGSGTTITTTGGGIVTGSSGLSQTILGSLTVNEGITANLTGTASWAASASNTPNALITASVNVNEITFTKGNGNQFTITVDTGSISPTLVAGGSQGQIQWNDGDLLYGLSVLTYDGTTLFATGTFTGSFTGSFVGDIAGTSSAALFVTSSNVHGPYGADSVLSSSYAQTASYAAVAQSLLGVLDSYPIILTGSTLYSYDSHRLNAAITGGVNQFYNFIMGSQAGFYLDGQTANYSTMIGFKAGYNSLTAVESNFLGPEAGANSVSSSNVFFAGTYSGKGSGESHNSIFMGFNSGESTSTPQSVFLGRFAGYRSGLSRNSIFIGRNAGRSVLLSNNSILLGFNVGNNAFGANAGLAGIGRNNIIIGTNLTLEEGRKDSINLGGILFATGAYYQADTDVVIAPYSGTVDGRIGINVVNPQYTLDVSGSGNFYNGIFVTGSINSSGSNNFIGQQSILGNIIQTGSILLTGSISHIGEYQITGGIVLTGSMYSTGSNIHIGTHTITGSLYTSGSNIFIGTQTVTGSLFTTGSNTLIGTTTLTGSLNITGSTTQIGNNTLLGNTSLSGSITISGSNQPGSVTASIQVYGDIRQTGYHRFDPVTTNIDTTISASYIYVSGSTNDLYFSQNGSGYANTTRLRWLEGNLYTGLLHGGVISASVGSTTFTITSGSGIIVSLNASTGSDPYPTIKYVNWGNLTNIPPSFLTTKIQTFVGIDSEGTVIQRTEPWTDGLYNTSLQIGTVLHQNKSTINATITYPNMAYGYKQRTYDFVKAFGPLKLSGYELLTSGTLGLTVGTGTAFSDGRNYQNDPNSPAFINDPGTTVSKIFRYYQSGSEFVQDTNNGIGYTVIDPSKYVDINGVLQNVGNNDFSNQRVFWYPNSATKGIVVYYGTATYADRDSAILNAQYERFSEVENTKQNAVYLGTIVIKGNGVFTSANDYRILPSGIFRSVTGGGGTTINVTALSNLSDVAVSSISAGDLLVYGNGSQWNNTKTLKGNYTISGSLSLTQGVTGSLLGTSSWATNSLTASTVLGGNDKYIALWSGSMGLLSSSIIYQTGSSIGINSTTPTGSLYVSGNIYFPSLTTSSGIPHVLMYNTSSGQLFYTASTAIGGGSGTGAGFPFSGSAVITGSLLVSGSTPTLTVSGTLNVNGSITGSLFGTASWANNSLTASYVTGSIFSGNNLVLSASYALTSSNVQGGAANYLALWTGSAGLLSSSLIYQTGSFIGIRTITPSFTLDVSGSSRFTSGSQITGSLLVNGTTVITGSLTLTGSVFVSGNLFLSGSTVFTGSSVISGSLNVIGFERISGSLIVTGSQSITSSTDNVLNVYGSGSTNPLFRVQGSLGEMFMVTDNISGSLLSINNSSGLPIFEVFSDNTTRIGLFPVQALYTTNQIVANSGSQNTVYSIPTASYEGAFYDYTLRSGSNARAGQIMAMRSSSIVNYTEVATADFGNTTGSIFSVNIDSSGYMNLNVECPSNTWFVKTIIRSI